MGGTFCRFGDGSEEGTAGEHCALQSGRTFATFSRVPRGPLTLAAVGNPWLCSEPFCRGAVFGAIGRGKVNSYQEEMEYNHPSPASIQGFSVRPGPPCPLHHDGWSL